MGGCSCHVGKMIYSAGVAQLALVAYVPDAEHNKSASKIDVQEWMDHVLTTVGGGKVLTAKTAATSPKGGHIVVASIPADAEKGKFPLKDKDSAMAAAFNFLRTTTPSPRTRTRRTRWSSATTTTSTTTCKAKPCAGRGEGCRTLGPTTWCVVRRWAHQVQPSPR